MTTGSPVFSGVAVALVTFFDDHGHVDLLATAKHAEHLVELRGRFEPYPTTAGFPPPLVGSVATREGGVEEREL